MTLTDRHLDELKRERWRGFEAENQRYAELLRTDAQAFGEQAAAAARRHDTLGVCAAGEALIEAGGLGFRALRRMGFAGLLLGAEVEERRYEAALKVFDSIPAENWNSANAWLARARALAATAQMKQAGLSLDRALEIDPKVRGGGEMLALLLARRRLKATLAETGGVGWADLRQLLEVYLALDMQTFASKLLRDRATDLPAPGPEDYADGVALLKAALPLMGPGFVFQHREALAKVQQDDRLEALVAECEIESGRPEVVALADEGGRDLRLQRALAVAQTGQLEEAIRRLGRHTVMRRSDPDVRAALAFCVGRQVQEENPLVLRPSGGPRRVFNLMPFNDEVELLKMHLAEMADQVDLFVIAESVVTFTGHPKPLHFERHRHEFSAYADKIRHLVMGAHPPAFDRPWSRDFRQRDLAVSAISGLAAADDLVLLTDVDEIVDHRVIQTFDGDMAGLRMAMFRFFLNYRPTADNFPIRPTGAVVRAGLLQRFGSSYIRFQLTRSKRGQMIDQAGWHFTSMCDPARLVAKMNSYAHQERGAEWRDLDRVDRHLSEIKGGAFESGWERADVDESFPAYIRQHRDELEGLLISAPAEQGA